MINKLLSFSTFMLLTISLSACQSMTQEDLEEETEHGINPFEEMEEE